MRMRRAFTLLELSLAMLMAAMLVIAALGLFMSLERSDRRFEKRYEQVGSLDRLQTVLRRTFATLAVTDETAPPGTPGIKAAGSATATPAPTRSADASASSSESSSTPSRATSVPAPRVRIIEDPDPAVRSMINRSKALNGGGGSEVLLPQLLEVVTAGQPVPDDNPDSMLSGGVTIAAASQGILLNRGAIYLRPTAAAEDSAEANPEERGWEILYTRLAPRDRLNEFGAAIPPLQPIGQPIVLASGIRYFNVKVFRERQWSRGMEATYFQHLPAYVQVEVETTTGLWAKWLFEVGWLLGPETQAEREFKAGGSADKKDAKDAKDGKDGTGTTKGGVIETKGESKLIEKKAIGLPIDITPAKK